MRITIQPINFYTKYNSNPIQKKTNLENSSDGFFPSFAGNTEKGIMRGKQEYLINPFLEESYDDFVDAEFNYQMMMDINAIREHYHTKIQNIVNSPQNAENGKIFQTVNKRLELYNQFKKNRSEYNSLAGKSKKLNFEKEYKEMSKVFEPTPEIKRLELLDNYAHNTKSLLRMRFTHIDVTKGTPLENTSFMINQSKQLYDLIPHVEAEKLSGDIDRYLCGEQSSVNPKELQKLEESIYFYHKHKAKIRQAIKDFVVPDYEIEDLDKNYKKFKQDYNKTLKSYSADLENFYTKHFSEKFENDTKLEIIIEEQNKKLEEIRNFKKPEPPKSGKEIPILQFVVNENVKDFEKSSLDEKRFYI